MKKHISKVAILGSGVMGSRIACHFANIGTEVLLLDIVPKAVEGSSKPNEKNQLVNDAADRLAKFGKDALHSFAEGDELRMMLMGLKRFT